MTNFTPTDLVTVIKDAAEVEETSGTEVGGDLLRLAGIGHVLHLRAVHHPQVGGDLEGPRCVDLRLSLGLRGQTRGLRRLGLFLGVLLSVKGHKHRLLLRLLLLLLLLRVGVVRPWWLHTVGHPGSGR